MMQRVLTALVAASFLAYATPAHAQRDRRRDGGTPVEFGVDAAATFTMGTPNFTVISIPAAQVRVGFFASPSWEFEPNFGLLSASGGGDRITQVQLGLGVL